MIITRLAGGLGNQLFQYAAVRRLAQHKGVDFALDITEYQTRARRVYRLGLYNIHERLATPEEILRAQGQPQPGLLARVWRQRKRLVPYYRRSVVTERHPYHFDPRMLDLPAECYLLGYWQNEGYFAPIADALRAEFVLKAPLSAPSAALTREIEATEAVGVHVRRGDYAHNPGILKRHGLCSPEYYQTCARQILRQQPRAVFYVFSDDLQWAAENLDLGGPRVLVDHNGPERDYEDMLIMSRCRYFIIANSSFSWWAAWLSNRPDKQVFAPSRWLASAQDGASGIVPAGWGRV